MVETARRGRVAKQDLEDVSAVNDGGTRAFNPCVAGSNPARPPGTARPCAFQAWRRAVWRRRGPTTPFNSTGPMSVNVTGVRSAASTISWVSRVLPGDVEKRDRRGMAHPTVQTGPLQRVLDVLDEALAPCVLLLPVVDGQEGLLDQGNHPGPQVGLPLQHLALGHASLEEGLLHLGLPPVRLGLGDPAQAVPAEPEPPLDDHRTESVRELELEHRHDRQLIL